MSSETELTLEQIAAEISDILSRRTRAKHEGKILGFIRLLQGSRLADLLDLVEPRRLVRALDDRLWGPDSRKEFLRLLNPVIELLSVSVKADLIRGLVRSGPSLAEEKFVAKLFLSEKGESLSRLKIQIDQAMDGHDLLRVVYRDINSADIRFELVQHFQNASHDPVVRKETGLRVVSDIDDTLYSSLNDSRFGKGTIYPGVLELLSQLSPFPPIFLTARPELAASLFERITHRQLNRYGIEGATVLSGSLPGLFGHQRMAEQKARTLVQYIELYPEFRFIFIGDSGQGDMALARKLLGRRPPPIERALIHKLGDYQPGSQSDHASIHTFENYGVAAKLLGSHGYLTEQQVTIVQQALES